MKKELIDNDEVQDASQVRRIVFMKYAVSEEGVQALQGIAQTISNTKEEVSGHAQKLKSAGDGQDLGPHAESIVSAAETIEDAINGASDSLEDIAAVLEDVADSYEEIIGNDRIRSAVGNWLILLWSILRQGMQHRI